MDACRTVQRQANCNATAAMTASDTCSTHTVLLHWQNHTLREFLMFQMHYWPYLFSFILLDFTPCNTLKNLFEIHPYIYEVLYWYNS
jgi:hypothetical protein